MKNQRIKWTKEDLEISVKNSKTFSETAKKLKIRSAGGNFLTIKKYIKHWNIDISHFLERKDYIKLKKTRNNEEIFCLNNISRNVVKRRIIKDKLIEYKCSKCGLKDWYNDKISLQLDHINGIYNDNRLENLRFLCPNCHSQTETFSGKNSKREKLPDNKCKTCDKKILRQSIFCRKCKPRIYKADYPSLDELLDMIEETSYAAVGRKFHVTDNAIRKTIKRLIEQKANRQQLSRCLAVYRGRRGVNG